MKQTITYPSSFTILQDKPRNLIGIYKPNQPDLINWYNKNYYTIRITGNTKKRISKVNTNESILHSELKQLTNITRLNKKLTNHFKSIEAVKYLNGDNKILKLKRIKRNKTLIRKYLSVLKQDKQFSIERYNQSIGLIYSGKYASIKRVVVF